MENGKWKISVVEATIDNTDDILKIEQACFSVPWSERSIKESIENENTYLYLALAGGKAAGYMGVQIFSGEGYVTNVATLPEYRRQGIARALMKRALENEMEFLTLEVRDSNLPAINLYHSLGFQEVGKRPRFYREPEEDAVLMTKYFGDE